MSWLPILLLALLTFIGTVFLLKLPRSVWALFGAALLFGLAGYAIQGSPGQAGAPRAATGEETARSGEAMVQARREFYAEGVLPSNAVPKNTLPPAVAACTGLRGGGLMPAFGEGLSIAGLGGTLPAEAHIRSGVSLCVAPTGRSGSEADANSCRVNARSCLSAIVHGDSSRTAANGDSVWRSALR